MPLLNRNGTILLVFILEEAERLKEQAEARFQPFYPNGRECRILVMCQGDGIAKAFGLADSAAPSALMVVVDVTDYNTEDAIFILGLVYAKVKGFAKAYGIRSHSRIVTELFTGKWVVNEHGWPTIEP